MFEICKQLLPTQLYTIHKTWVSDSSDSACRLCRTTPEGMVHILPACPALVQTKYLARHDAVLKFLFFEIIFDLCLIDTVPVWYSPVKPQSVYETAGYRRTGMFRYMESTKGLRANRLDARIINNRDKQVIALEMSCPWVSNRDNWEDFWEAHEVRATEMGTEAEIPRVREQRVQYHLRCIGGMVQGLWCHSTEASRQQS